MVFYVPVASESYEMYLSIRDTVLGWPSQAVFGRDGEHDKTGSRIVPAFPDPEKINECISLYGDSFTWSVGADAEHSWGNELSKLVGCRVSNYGVGGYGSDQAYLRFKENLKDASKIVFLNHSSENILRNVNQYRDLLYPGERLGFKPRFILDDNGKLVLVPLPTLTQVEYRDFVGDPGKYLRYEFFTPEGASGVTYLSFPYTFSAIRSLGHFHIKAEIGGYPWYLKFYERGHPAQGLEVTVEILLAFQKEAVARGKTPIVTIIPTGLDLLFHRDNGVWPYQSLIEELDKKGVGVLNFGDGIVDCIKNEDLSSFFNGGNTSEHFNARGYELLARIAYGYLVKERLLSLVADL
jgi:hypothetical protein